MHIKHMHIKHKFASIYDFTFFQIDARNFDLHNHRVYQHNPPTHTHRLHIYALSTDLNVNVQIYRSAIALLLWMCITSTLKAERVYSIWPVVSFAMPIFAIEVSYTLWYARAVCCDARCDVRFAENQFSHRNVYI